MPCYVTKNRTNFPDNPIKVYVRTHFVSFLSALIPEFVLNFPTPSTSNYVELNNTHTLHAITVAFYMRTSFKDPNSRATPVSYSYKDKSGIVDNALTLLDTNSFVLYIHGEVYHTEYSANRYVKLLFPLFY